MMLTLKYRETHEGGFLGRVIEMPGVITFGHTLDDLRENAVKAVRAMAASYVAEDASEPGYEYVNILVDK